MMTNARPRYYVGATCGLGDIVYILYTIMALADTTSEADIFIGPYVNGQWTQTIFEPVIPLIREQWYVNSVTRVSQAPPDLTYDFTKMYDLDNFHEFFEWNEVNRPGNCQLKKRWYLSSVRHNKTLRQALKDYNNDQPWLEEIYHPTYSGYHIIIHAPKRKLCRPWEEWRDNICKPLSESGHTIAIVGGSDLDEWEDCRYWSKIKTDDLSVVANYIASAKLFMGTASCNYVIAEGLDQFRLVEFTADAEGTVPQNHRGADITHWSNTRIVKTAKQLMSA